MKEILQLSPSTLERIHNFTKRIAKKKDNYDRFKSIVEQDFAPIIQEDVNVCVYCKGQFKGKSIGPHYKNSKECANYKLNLKKAKARIVQEEIIVEQNNVEVRPREEREPVRANFNYDVFQSSEENLSVDLEDVDDFFYSE